MVMDNTSGDFPCNKMDTRKQLPLTPSQQGFLFHSLKDKKRSNYHEHFTCIFSQHVDSAHFKWALETLFRKHECFRTDYNWEIDERPCQVVKTDVLPDIYVLDCEQEEIRFLLANDDIIIPVPQDDGIDAIIPQLLQADLKYPFSLKTIPVRAYLIQSTKESAFILSYHHIVMDGWSLSLFIKQLLQLYGAAVVSGVRDDSAIIPSSLKPLVDTLSARRHTFSTTIGLHIFGREHQLVSCRCHNITQILKPRTILTLIKQIMWRSICLRMCVRKYRRYAAIIVSPPQ